MDIRKWQDKYSTDIRLLYNSKATQDNYKSQVCRGKRAKTCGGFIWKYKD